MNSSFFVSTQKWEHLSNQEPHNSSAYTGVSMVNMPRDASELRPIWTFVYFSPALII